MKLSMNLELTFDFFSFFLEKRRIMLITVDLFLVAKNSLMSCVIIN